VAKITAACILIRSLADLLVISWSWHWACINYKWKHTYRTLIVLCWPFPIKSLCYFVHTMVSVQLHIVCGCISLNVLMFLVASKKGIWPEKW